MVKKGPAAVTLLRGLVLERRKKRRIDTPHLQNVLKMFSPCYASCFVDVMFRLTVNISTGSSARKCNEGIEI